VPIESERSHFACRVRQNKKLRANCVSLEFVPLESRRECVFAIHADYLSYALQAYILRQGYLVLYGIAKTHLARCRE
jgi:hypothetical protein